VEEAKARGRELIGRCSLLGLSRVPLGRIPGDVDTVDADLLARGVGCNDNTACIRSANWPKSNEMGGTTLGGCKSRMGQEPVGVAGVLQLRRYLRPSAVGVLIQQSNDARPGDAEQGRLVRRVEGANRSTAEGGICPPAI